MMASASGTMMETGRACQDCDERVAREAPGPDVVPVATACVARIAALAAQPLSPRILLQIERYVQIARQAWAVEQGEAPMSRPQCDAVYMGQGLSVGPMSYPMQNPVMQSLGFSGGPIAPAAQGPAENFGASAIRELVEAFTTKKPEEIVQAIGAARTLGLMDLARKLERQLGVESAEPTALAALPETV